ncbi:MAG: AraC family transcriptional regulator, partial [Acidobacteriota bacterium]
AGPAGRVLSGEAATAAGAAGAPGGADPGPKYARQSLEADTRQAHLQRIHDFMDAERPYLDGELTLADLADAVAIPKHHVSMVINIERQQNFFQFVNSYRVDAARGLLSDPGEARETLLNIAYRAGFQSKAAFNRVFKKVTGETPGQYRKARAEKPA